MISGWTRKPKLGAPGRTGRPALMLVCALAACCLVAFSGVSDARISAEAERAGGGDVPAAGHTRASAFFGWYHSVGQLLLHVSNYGWFGDWGADLTAPSAEWPAGSNNNYLYAAGIWVGAIVGPPSSPDTLVSAAVYQQEFLPDLEDPLATIYETWEGAANGTRQFDDDGDCNPYIADEQPFNNFDEDPLDRRDNDGDGLIDEDFAAISQQMYRTEYYDTYEDLVNENASPGDEHHSLGLKVIQESYEWTSDLTDDFVGINFDVVNIGQDTLRMVYVGFMVDADVGPESTDVPNYTDDKGGFIDTVEVTPNPNNPSLLDTLSMTIAYMYDDPSPTSADGNVAKGYIGCMFLGHPTARADTLAPGELPAAPTRVRVHAFEIWSSGTEDPNNDRDRYRYLRGVADYPLLDGIDNNGNGQVDEPDEWRVNIDRNALSPEDWRFMLSAGPFRRFTPGDTLSVQYAFVVGKGLDGMLENAATAQQIYNGITEELPNCVGESDSVHLHWVADTPPPPPHQEITAGDRFVRIEWDDFPEGVEDPLTRLKDFYGYQVWKAVGWTRESSEPKDEDWELVLDIDRRQHGAELAQWDTGLEGVGKYAFVDTLVRNGFAYWYSVTAYDSTGEGYHFGKYTQDKTLVFPHSAVTNSVDDVIVVPNPYVKNSYMARWNLAPDESDPTGEKICFQNLPRDAVVRIYSLGGELVKTLYPVAEHTGGDACWNMVSRNDQIIVSGVYLYHIDSPAGEKIGKFVVIK